MFQTDLSKDARYRQFDDVQDLIDEIAECVEIGSASRPKKLFRVLVTVGDLEGEYSSLRPELALILDLSCSRFRGGDPSTDAPARLADIDRWVGMRVRTARELAELTRQDLAERIGVTDRQIHRYESGQCRIGAGRLYQIAVELRRPTRFFYAGFGDREEDPDGFDHAAEKAAAEPADSPAAYRR